MEGWCVMPNNHCVVNLSYLKLILKLNNSSSILILILPVPGSTKPLHDLLELTPKKKKKRMSFSSEGTEMQT